MKRIQLSFLAVAAFTASAAADVEYIAHAGEENLAPAHSKAAYRLAAEHKLDYLKLDLRETKDGHVVMQHDGNLYATMRWKEKIANLTLEEIRKKGRCVSRGGYKNETITTLTEALEIARGMRKGLWLDFKYFTPKFAEKVFRRLDEAGYGPDKLIVATWNRNALKWVQQNRPQVRRVAHTYIRKLDDGYHVNATKTGEPGEVVCATESDVAEALDALGKALGLYGFNLPSAWARDPKRKGYNTSPKLISDVKSRGYWVSIWFVFHPEAGEFYRKAGADAFVTNCKANTFASGNEKSGEGKDRQGQNK